MAEIKVGFEVKVKGLDKLQEKVEKIEKEFVQDFGNRKNREIAETMRQKLIAKYPGAVVTKSFIGKNIKIGISNIGQLNKVKIERLTKETAMLMEKLQEEAFKKAAK